MVKICSYSTLILSGNIVVLLTVSVATDYWQYRGYDHHNISLVLGQLEGVQVTRPRDTVTYLTVTTMMSVGNVTGLGHVVHYQSPMYVRVFDNGTVDGDGNVMAVVQVFLYSEYGNLFRDCENLEDSVRYHLGLQHVRPEKCLVLKSVEPTTSNENQGNQDTVRVGSAALCMAILSIVCLTCSLAAGSAGSLYNTHRHMYIAAMLSLLAGIVLISSIALFNGKTHLQWRGEPLPRLSFPHKQVIVENKFRAFGWSFALAWICVAMMFSSAFSWLYKAEHLLVPEENDYVQLGETGEEQNNKRLEDIEEEEEEVA